MYIAIILLGFSLIQANDFRYENILGFRNFYYKGEKISFDGAMSRMRANNESFQHMKKARNAIMPYRALGIVGGAFVGWELGTRIGGGEKTPSLLWVGGGCILASIPFAYSLSLNCRKAVDSYNSYIVSEEKKKVDVQFYASFQGAGIRLLF